jgi:spore germination cell wall hydrolase CwlJ-like protein
MGMRAGTGAERARRELAALRATGGVLLAVWATSFSTGATGPAYGSLRDFDLPGPTASIVRSGDEVLITGSVGHLFAPSFSGTNKAEKRDRLRPEIDPVALSSAFDSIRARIAALRNPDRELPEEPAPAVEVPPVMVAALVPEIKTSALTAIDEAALGGGAPLPRTQSDQLAYARADAPITIFDGVLKDKNGNRVSEKELNCMATAIYFEARGEAYRGQVAVGQVVLNRVAHRLYPETICSVVYQNKSKRNACQFSFACDGIPERVTEAKAWAQAEEIAKGIISGELYLPEVGYSTHYHATYVRPQWAPRMTKVTKIGQHVFYQFKRGWRFG